MNCLVLFLFLHLSFSFGLEWNRKIEQNPNGIIHSPCGQKYTSRNGTIEFYAEIFASLDCLIFIEVDDGQNIFLRFDDLQWDTKENFLEIGLFHDYNQHRIFHISGRLTRTREKWLSVEQIILVDVMPKTWFVANDSQIWIRFSSSQYSLGVSAFRLYYSETIQCKKKIVDIDQISSNRRSFSGSTISPEPYVQILDDHRLFPYRLISLPTNHIYHNLTQVFHLPPPRIHN